MRKGNDCHDVKIRHTPTAMIVIVWRERVGMKAEEIKRNIRGKERRVRRCIGEEGYDYQDLSDVTDHNTI